jgi:cell division protein FtsI (penicillin-binding protein 3)
MTPLQVLSYYNAIANNGIYVKPQFIEQIRKGNQIEKQFKTEVIHPSIASRSTLKQVQQLLRNVVEKPFGTAHKLYDPYFSMAGKTGTSQLDYHKGNDEIDYISSFAGYFPADNPQYSCIVVVHRPDKNDKIYGADVAGPVFKSIAQKIYATSPHKEVIQLDKQFALLKVISPSVTATKTERTANRM